MQPQRRRWADICSRRVIFKLMLVSLTIFVALQIVELFVNIHYNAIPRYIQRTFVPDDHSAKVIEVNASFEIDPKLDGYSWLQCKCAGRRNINFTRNDFNSQSTCSNEATDIGFGQKVISYSLFVSTTEAIPFFFNGIVPNLNKLRDIYPGWLVRIYTNVPINDHTCLFICQHDHLFWCNIERIPKLGDVSSVNGRVWRFLPLGDPTVDIFVSRDLDSLATTRERNAVTEWEGYNKTFHLMRDSQWHKTEILAGLWGAKNSLLDPSLGMKLRAQIIEDGRFSVGKTVDQSILTRRIFYPFLDSFLAHDSYYCGKYKESITLPFPTKRNGQEFAGHDDLQEADTLFVGLLKPCPIECRPSYGKDWQYC
ncbi:uncharacterized protein LOC119078954 [Bradysia coprophila]|uniref:uncharacterized protein LOC119078954 n=1 Tax=Bradysia coprophila TaxID=38358 RepID=UPI00187DBBA1|nr:uncharacterized protein LOC119078954 [Bradysia coprophila]XP_037042598.1 uncharacterized protein LOC119078954 [Bradysia coprophila]XP_037042599.1 uncharacterized protein LOC119078954 [Bradysia coprophila]